MTLNEIAWELYRDEHDDGKTWNELSELVQEIYIDYAKEVLDAENDE